MRRYLFVCLANRNRSPYAARWFSKYCTRTGIEAEVKSAGLEAEYVPIIDKRKPVKLTPELVRWADEILVMDSDLERTMFKRFPNANRKTSCLNIPDIFDPDWEEQPYISKMSLAEALDHLNLLRTGEGNRIGRNLFEKILQARLGNILGFKF